MFDYMHCSNEEIEMTRRQSCIQSKLHEVYTIFKSKIALSPYDYKWRLHTGLDEDVTMKTLVDTFVIYVVCITIMYYYCIIIILLLFFYLLLYIYYCIILTFIYYISYVFTFIWYLCVLVFYILLLQYYFNLQLLYISYAFIIYT